MEKIFLFDYKNKEIYLENIDKENKKEIYFSDFDSNLFFKVQLKDWIELSINTKGVENSNNFLKSLWREFNLNLSPNGLDKCPWAYTPNYFEVKNKKINCLGSVRTKYGYFHVLISSKRKGDIDNIYFLNIKDFKNESYKSVFKGLIKKAKKNINDKFLFEIEYIIKNENLNYINKIANYEFDNFKIGEFDDKNLLVITTEAFDKYDAELLGDLKINKIIDFLSIETNLNYSYELFSVKLKNEVYDNEKINLEFIYQEDIKEEIWITDGEFKDLIPIYEGNVLLSKSGIKIIEMILNNIENESLKLLLKSAHLFRNGLENEFKKERKIVAIDNKIVLSSQKNAIKYKPTVNDMSMTLYLSAIETISIKEYKDERCRECNQVKYGIVNRVINFVNNYLDDESDDYYKVIYKNIYNLRSKFMHSGEVSYNNLNNTIRPLLDINTSSGSIDVENISIKRDGKTFLICLMNIREWTSLCLRRFYKKDIIK